MNEIVCFCVKKSTKGYYCLICHSINERHEDIQDDDKFDNDHVTLNPLNS